MRPSTGPTSPPGCPSRTSPSLPQPPNPCEMLPLTYNASRLAELLQFSAPPCMSSRKLVFYLMSCQERLLRWIRLDVRASSHGGSHWFESSAAHKSQGTHP